MTVLAPPIAQAEQAVRLTNARLILPDAVVHGALRIRAGHIEAIERRSDAPGATYDCAGDYVLPGLIELHTDNLEKHLMPRAGVLWPGLSAVLSHDAQLIAAGITTALAAVTLGDLEEGSVRSATLTDTVAALDRASVEGLLRAEHYLHLRCELAYPYLPALLGPLVSHARVRLLSVMDHTPGQRQYRDSEQYRRFYARSGITWDDAEFIKLIAARVEQQSRYRNNHLADVLALVRQHRLVLASHDDAEPEHVIEALQIGASIAEFPTTRGAAHAARAAGLAVVAGAPNLIRGGSHAGNVAALELAQANCLDILSSDYVPASLLHGAFLLHESVGWDLPRAVAAVTRTPARALGFDDRGGIVVGQRADLVRVRMTGSLPVVQAVWVRGARMY
ncbi:alpha-D-ribose 1-methylphosphonate 5-triphosphate diphosphatase [Dokdonella soli]|uniref:Alpha-D-ribose 1-methylphosphonate 5-triphosphate diphosphatase n=1 Tax=Dokdonella soli TaxID=529810 RepID=A0ABN1IQU7_9GAMM